MGFLGQCESHQGVYNKELHGKVWRVEKSHRQLMKGEEITGQEMESKTAKRAWWSKEERLSWAVAARQGDKSWVQAILMK